MAYDPSFDTDDRAVPGAVRRFLRNRLFELASLLLFAVLITLGVALATWSAADPSLNHALDRVPENWLGYPGAVVADEFMQLLGLGVLPLVAIPMAWAARLAGHQPVRRPFRTLGWWLLAVLCLSTALAAIPAPNRWALASGLGGTAGDIINGLALAGPALLAQGWLPQFVTALVFTACGFVSVWRAVHVAPLDRAKSPKPMAPRAVSKRPAMATWRHLRDAFQSLRQRHGAWQAQRKAAEPADRGDIIARLAPARPAGRGRIEPRLERMPAMDALLAPDDADEMPADAVEEEGLNVERAAPEIKAAKRRRKEPAPSPREAEAFELPPLELLSEPKRIARAADLTDEALEQNARALEGVLDDFGVKGQIINVKPGPVVTLYELEPAPGIKSSRVISLADDIARSMSAISARVAVVPGRNAIGIELPNAKRETVYLRELLGSEAFANTGQNLALALGKNIGGEPIFADLARMPHLLIAGTTGSGKSVGINTMILSLVYRLPPERCKLIMIDPKMLELSVYEGIPHLLSPVVTDPRKAIVALKWAVREMEERYRKMSKVGVRNIDGYNARVKQALSKGEGIARTVQTGFDASSGEPVFEREQMELSAMPYIVVIIDEMADLMMVAGKDIEGAVQRLAQMARAAGIHVVMATQRPSVDVITGTIKANFPTRVSFQVTSKIDSRTILGEQGAEQLLGQGDMLYMAGGGRISRLHGPFVSDGEVEKIVRHLKSQGAPEYIEAVTEEPEEGEYGDPGAMAGDGGGSGDDLYDQAVAVVLRDKKVSTSYVQRRLQVGYNKAASLIERMEKEGLISPANGTGKREILVPGDSARD